MTDEDHNASDMGRRTMLQTAGVAVIAGLAAGGMPTAAAAAIQGADSMSAAERNEAPLGARLQGVQHFGLTVQNMERASEFYTAVLGGTEVFRHGDFQGDGVQNTLLADQEIEANARGVNPRTIGVPDLRGGAQRLDVRFIQFDNVVIELLQYRDSDQPVGSSKSFAEPVQHMSPAFPRMMHICFYVRDDVDFNKFIADLEAESARRGMTQVRANRTIRVMTEADRKAAPRSANTNRVTEAPSDGWELIYCKGPEGEQLEFVKALGRQATLQRGPDETTTDRTLIQMPAALPSSLPLARRYVHDHHAREFIMQIRVRNFRAAILCTMILSMTAPSAVAEQAPHVRYQEIRQGAYSVVAQVRAKPGKEDALRAATLPLIALVRGDPKNLVYFLQEDRTKPGHFIFYEIFASQADFEAHNAMPYVQEWFAKLPELADGGVEVMRMAILGASEK
jgi:quinol monooxygenase YgiN/catechol 2,3-dioxygenase-like lactoylglutathione lyase family enzyme